MYMNFFLSLFIKTVTVFSAGYTLQQLNRSLQFHSRVILSALLNSTFITILFIGYSDNYNYTIEIYFLKCRCGSVFRTEDNW
jgi:hypothetical protein